MASSVAAGVLSVHGLLCWALMSATFVAPSRIAPADSTSVTVHLIETHRVQDSVPLPEPIIDKVTIQTMGIGNVTFEDVEAGEIKGVVGCKSVPRIDEAVKVDSAPYASRAGMSPGMAATVVLSVQVLSDGSVGEVQVQASSGDSRVDTEAVVYARALQWIPGTEKLRAQTMRVSVSVTLAVPA